MRFNVMFVCTLRILFYELP